MQNTSPTPLGTRLESLDIFRGLTMLLMISEGFGLHYFTGYPIVGGLATQFTHHEWHGLHFWDLIQPFFMFIVGVAMPFAFKKRWDRGEIWNQSLKHVIKRSVILFILGVVIMSYYSKKPAFRLENVLTQIAFTYLFAFLLMKKSLRTQLIVSLVILFVYDLAYRFIPLPNVTYPWEKNNNLGAFMDMIIQGQINEKGGWVAINFISTAAHTIWGVVAGQILMSERIPRDKIKLLLYLGITGVIAGLALDPVTPIIKRIATSTFVINSGGWCFLTLLFLYWLVDLKGYKNWGKFLMIIGMNSIFIYLVRVLLHGWLDSFFGIFTMSVLQYLGVLGKFIHENILIFTYWYICYFLYKNKLFFKL